MNFQYYPTPPDLARRAWRKFKNRSFVRVLEPSAGEGHLLDEAPTENRFDRNTIPKDCYEIDVTRQGILRNKGYNVVGLDFLQMASGAIYSHIILNPPFSEGAKHVLKAWDALWDGEIVAIVNAETIRNPFSNERQMLNNLIDRFGEVEFIEKAFVVPEAERKTEVDVALIYLCKKANVDTDIYGDLIGELKRDRASGGSLGAQYQDAQAVALPASFVENTVLAFNAAVRSMREAVFAEAKASYYTALLGETMAVRNGDGGSTKADTSVEWVQREVGTRYLDLKDRAWAGILRSSNVSSRLSSAAQRRLESEFENIKKLEFTNSNIYGFLCGIVASQGDIQIEMACDVFDLITRYHTDNTVFYKGWKSNDKHRTAGMRIKTSRFILPGHGTNSWHSSLSWDSEQLLRDFDKVFALLDGKREPEMSLEQVFRDSLGELRRGNRVSASYFDLRYYPGAGTIHFFARDKALIDRLNRLVGRRRQWLPPEGARVNEAFWLQYEKAEKFDKEIRTEINKRASGNYWNHPLHQLFSSDKENHAKAISAIDEAAGAVLERHGISVDFLIEDQEQRLLSAA